MEVNLNTNLHFQFVYYLVLGLKISSHASRAQKASKNIMVGKSKLSVLIMDGLQLKVPNLIALHDS